MDFPAELRNEINTLAEETDIKLLSRAAESLSKNYRSEKPSGKLSAASPTEILAYSAVRMPATFGAVSRAIELSLQCFGETIGSVLDVGAGTGAGAIAAALLTECSEIVCIEREPNMISLGERFCGCTDIRAKWIRRDVTAGVSETADLVICSYCLNELPESLRGSVLKDLINAAKKLLVIVEPGTPNSFSYIKRARGELIQNGMRIAAPCPNIAECPLPADDWCHFTARVGRSALHKRLKGADVPYEDEKFCFLAAAHGSVEQCGARILRHPAIKPGRITLEICSESGISQALVTKSDPLFKSARKADTGDTLDIKEKT